MNDSIRTARTLNYQVGEWRVVPSSSRLTRDDEEARITPRAMDVLVHLIERAGETVSNEELLTEYWVGGITSTNALHKTIRELRLAFGDDRHEARYIETVQKRGYRLVADVALIEALAGAPLEGNGQASEVEPAADAPSSNGGGPSPEAPIEPTVASTESTPEPSASHRHARTRVVAWSIAGLVVVAAAGFGLIRYWSPFGVVSGTGTEARVAPSVGILPLRNLGNELADEFYGEGVAEAIGHAVARVPGIQVKQPGLPFIRQTTGQTLSERATALDVNHIVEGTVQHVGDRLRVTLHLVRAADGVQLYSDQFDEPVSKIFEMQDDIAAEVAKALSVHLDEGRRARMLKGTTNVDAYLAILEAHYRTQLPGRDNALKMIDASRRAVALDPKYVNAYWCLVVGLSNLMRSGAATPTEYRDALAEMRAIASRSAVAIPGSGVDNATAATLAQLTGDLVSEEATLREVIKQLDSPVRQYFSSEGRYAHLLMAAGLIDESAAYQELDRQRRGLKPEPMWEPVDVTRWRDGGLDAVIAREKAQLNAKPDDLNVLWDLVGLLARAGQLADAKTNLDLLRTADSWGGYWRDAQAGLAVYEGTLQAGSPELAAFVNDPLTFDLTAGRILFMLGDVDGGIVRWARLDAPQRVLLHDGRLRHEYHFPKAVRDDPRYRALLDRLGIGAQWRHHLEEKIRELEPFTGIGLAADHPDRKPQAEWRWKL